MGSTSLRNWFVEDEDRWLVAFAQGSTRAVLGDVSESRAERWFADSFPAVADWLNRFKSRAAVRQDRGDFWWELRACDYYDVFERPKIVWPDIAKLPRFSADMRGLYLGNTCYAVAVDDYFLLGVLASWPTWFMISRLCQPLRLRGGRWQYRLFRQFMERLPIPVHIRTADREAIAVLARQCCDLGPKCYRIEQDVLKCISAQILTDGQRAPKALQSWWDLNSDRFVDVVESIQHKPFAGALAAEWRSRLPTEQANREAIRSEIESAEAELSERVAAAFGLNREEFKTVMDAVST